MRSILSFLFFFLACSISYGQIIKIEQNIIEEDSIKWHGKVEFGLDQINNGNNIFKLHSGSQIVFHQNKTDFISLNQLRLSFADGNTLEQQGFQHFRYRYSKTKTFTLESFIQSQFDQVLNIKNRFLGGLGTRLTFYQKETDFAFLGLSYMYEYELDTEDNLLTAHRLNSYLSLHLQLGENIQLNSSGYYQPNFADFKDYRMISNSSISFIISKRINLDFGADIGYDSSPIEGAPNFTSTVTSSLGIVF